MSFLALWMMAIAEMRPNNHIRIAGLGVSWPEGYSWIYKEKLDEVGLCAKVIECRKSKKEYVAYSHRPFTKSEADLVLSLLLDGETDEMGEEEQS